MKTAIKEKEISVIRIQNPFSFRAGFMIKLVRDAFKNHPVIDPDKMILELQRMSRMSSIAIFAGQENMQWKAFVVVKVPNGGIMTKPEFMHLYNKGSARLRREIVTMGIDWIKGNGYNSLVASNINMEQDAEFKRLFRWVGKIEKICTFYQFDFKGK